MPAAPAPPAATGDRPPITPQQGTPVGAIVALSLAALASGMSMRMTDPLLPRLAGEFHITLGQASWVVTVFAVAYGLAQAFFGPLGDRYGKLRVITGACLAASAANLACAFAPGFDSLLAARILAGAACAGVIPLSMAWIGDATPYETRQGVLARYLLVLALMTILVLATRAPWPADPRQILHFPVHVRRAVTGRPVRLQA